MFYVRCAEDAQFLHKELLLIEEKCEELGVKVVVQIGDNARNVQAACAFGQACNTEYFVFFSGLFSPNGFKLNSLAHSANLLMQDLGKIFKKQFEQAMDI